MKVKLGQIVNAVQPLNKITQEKMPAYISFKFSDNLEEIEPKLSTFQKEKNKLIVELGEKDEETGDTRIDPSHENFSKYQEELSKLLDNEVDINITKISRDEMKHIQISPSDLMAIKWMTYKKDNDE